MTSIMKKLKRLKNQVCWVWEVGQFEIFNMVIRIDFNENIRYEQRVKGAEGDIRERVFPAKETASLKVLREERAQHAQGITTRLV